MMDKHDPKLSLVATLTSARTYHFQSTEPLGGWALCTVNDVTGELLITSDWGNWSHIWNPKYLGSPSLTHFIADRHGYDYLANKLLGQRSAWVLDAESTIAQWRKKLVMARLRAGRRYAAVPDCLRIPSYLEPLDDQKPLTADRAREIWHALGSLLDCAHAEQIFLERAMLIDGIGWISDFPWEDTAHCYSCEYRVLINFLLPALSTACAATAQGLSIDETKEQKLPGLEAP